MFLDDYFLTFFWLMVVVTGTVDGVDNTISYLVETVAERMIVTVFVVISHVKFVLFRGIDRSPSSLFYSDLLSCWCLRARVNEFDVSLTEAGL